MGVSPSSGVRFQLFNLKVKWLPEWFKKCGRKDECSNFPVADVVLAHLHPPLYRYRGGVKHIFRDISALVRHTNMIWSTLKRYDFENISTVVVMLLSYLILKIFYRRSKFHVSLIFHHFLKISKSFSAKITSEGISNLKRQYPFMFEIIESFWSIPRCSDLLWQLDMILSNVSSTNNWCW